MSWKTENAKTVIISQRALKLIDTTHNNIKKTVCTQNLKKKKSLSIKPIYLKYNIQQITRHLS